MNIGEWEREVTFPDLEEVPEVWPEPAEEPVPEETPERVPAGV